MTVRPPTAGRLRLVLITCDMLYRPIEHVIADSPHEVVVRDLSASLHAEPRSLRERIQGEIDAVETADPEAHAILLGYGLCGGATAGIVARSRPIVLPRGHDCLTVLLGSRERYRREHEATPGTYWFTEDNVTRGTALTGWLLGDAGRSDAVAETRRSFIERFGEDNADYLMTTLGEWQRHYERGAYIDSGLGGDDEVVAEARDASNERGWRFERVPADLGILERLVSGAWDEDFIVVEPGHLLAIGDDREVLRTVPG